MRNYLASAALAIASIAACHTKSDPPKADNTAENKRDPGLTPNADKASNDPADRDLAQQIRKAVVADNSLSTNAHNCKIVVHDGEVTLVGPVASADERTKVERIAQNIVGDPNKVADQLTVTD